MRKLFSLFWRNLEAIIWITAFILFAFASTDFIDSATICPFHSLGWAYCPGCGLGRSIILLFHGQFRNSFEMHPLGIPAVLILSWRIVTLLYKPASKRYQPKSQKK
ncbi:MAG: DUF2752 domain-containing protein [Bacteroidales bacterium]|nr:DUF2752 domain-containing protein [Bacteroidales bacterium]